MTKETGEGQKIKGHVAALFEATAL